MKLRVNNIDIDPKRVRDRIEFSFDSGFDLDYVTLKGSDIFGDIQLSEIQLEQSTVSTPFVEPMESETVASGIFKSVQGLSYEITSPDSDTWAQIKQSVEGSITTYHNGPLKSTLALTVNDVIFGIRDIVSGDQASFNLRLEGIQQVVKDEMFESVQTQLSNFVGIELQDVEGRINTIQNTVDGSVQQISDLEGNFNTMQDTLDGSIQRIGNVEGDLNVVQSTASSNTQSLTSLSGQYNTIKSTVDSHSQTIGTSGGNLAQMVMNDSLFKIDVIDEISEAKSSVNVLSNSIGLRSSGNTIYIGGRGILIDAESIYLGSSTQIGDGVITNRMIASNAQIDAAKIYNLTVSNAQIISLDVSKLSGNTSNFVSTSWNGINSSVQINYNGLEMMGSATWRRNIMNATGIELFNGSGGYRLAGTIGYFKGRVADAIGNESVINYGTGKHYIGIAANPTHDVAIGYNSSDFNNRNYNSAIRVRGDDGNIYFDKQMFIPGTSTHLHFQGNQIREVSQIRMRGPSSDSIAGIFNDGSSDLIWVQGWGGVRIGDRRPADSGYQNHLQVTNASVSTYVPLNLNNNPIWNDSDIRLKTDVSDSEFDALQEIDRLRFIDFSWDETHPRNEGKSSGRQFGIVAQYSPFLQAIPDDEDSYLKVDLSKQVNLNSKATQELLNYARNLEERIEVLEDGK